jgi:hypothetical protein
LAALASFDDAKTPGVILAAYEALDVGARRVALNTLAGRVEYAASWWRPSRPGACRSRT